MHPEHTIPHLVTAQVGPFYALEKNIIHHSTKIESWFRKWWQQNQPIITSSVDLRNAGFKIAAIDTNLYPAGFNNLNPDFYPIGIQALQSVLFERYPHCQEIMIMAESHTRNTYYYQSLFTLQEMILSAGYEVRLGSLLVQDKPLDIELAHQSLRLHPIERNGDKIKCDGIAPCLIILNNDFSEGIPEIIKDVKQNIDPPSLLGWSTRSKSKHFEHYQNICEVFADLIGIDVWQISALYDECKNVDFVNKDNMESLIEKTASLLDRIQKKYDEYHIDHKPYVIIKADAGTYGMAVMTVRDAKELNDLNRKQRLNMSIRKGGQEVHDYILQEGIYTFETLGDEQSVAEPVVYMFGQHVIGGFYRVHRNRKFDESLNAPGMHFEMLAFDQCCNNPNQRQNTHLVQNQFYVYSVIARLALMASCKERDEIQGKPSHDA